MPASSTPAGPAPFLKGLPGPRDAGSVRIGRPPARGSADEAEELEFVREVVSRRTPEGDRWAKRMDEIGERSMWWDLAAQYRREAGLVQGLAGAALLGTAMAASTVAITATKLAHGRLRPFQVDPSIPPLADPKSKSFPSGHAAHAYTGARILSRLEPRFEAQAYDAARQVAESRVYAGVHFPSDVVAGARLGTGIADRLLAILPGV